MKSTSDGEMDVKNDMKDKLGIDDTAADKLIECLKKIEGDFDELIDKVIECAKLKPDDRAQIKQWISIG